MIFAYNKIIIIRKFINDKQASSRGYFVYFVNMAVLNYFFGIKIGALTAEVLNKP